MAFLKWNSRTTSKNAKWLREIQEAKGIKVKTLDDEPELPFHLRWVWKAFSDLNYRRGTGFSGPVPFTYSDIESYCRLKGIVSLKERERLIRLIDALDRAYMAAFYEKQAANSPSNKGAPPPPTHSPPRNGRARRGPRQTF